MIGEGLSPAARALLDAARDGMAPDAASMARMRAKVASSAGATATTAIAIKLGLVALVATLAAGAAIYGDNSRSATPPRIELPSTQVESVAPMAQSRADSPTAAAPDTSKDPAIEMAPQRMTRPKLTEVAAPDAPVASGESHAVPAPRADLAREVELVDLAMAALRRGDTTSALSAIRTHATETRGAGQLAEDAAAIEIEALCRRHDPSVSTKLDAFDVRFPRSAQRSRLSVNCP